MYGLRRIGNHKRKEPDYLGVIGSFLIETLDDDKILDKLAPKYFNRWNASHQRLFDKNARLILKNFRNDAVIVIKSTQPSGAEIVALNGPTGWLNTEIVEDIRRLASHRWPRMILTIKTNKIRKKQLEIIEIFKGAGWVESIITGKLQIQLSNK